ncbi:MAG: IS110 family RNA-guided transposase [Acidimicrobiales bacterium]
MTVMIGVDPHKGSHTAVAIDEREQVLGELRVRTGPKQLERLLSWAAQYPERSWAIENATGLGFLVAQQLVGAGERVLDVQPKLAARVRLLATEATNKNDPHDARSVAVAAMRSNKPSEVRAEDHAAVAKLYSKRHKDLGRAKNKVACRLHSLLCDLVAGGVPEEITAKKAERLLDSVAPIDAVSVVRVELGREMLADMVRLDEQMKDSAARMAAVVAASGTSVTKVFGVGPVIAAAAIGITGDLDRFANRHHFASFNGTAPIDVSSGGKKVYRLSMRGNRQLNHAIHMAAIVQLRFAHSPGRPYYDRKVAEGKTHKEALRCLKRRISDAIYDCLVEDAKRKKQGPGGQAGNDSSSSATGSHPATPALRTSHSQARSNPTPARPGRTVKPAAARTTRRTSSSTSPAKITRKAS